MFNMCNVVTYDGLEAKVVKMVLSYESGSLTKESKDFLDIYKVEKDEKILYVDLLYSVTLEYIIALKEYDNLCAHEVYDLFEKFFNQNR